MISQCHHENRNKHGKDRKGQQRWKCRTCGTTFTSEESRPLGDMRIDLDAAAQVLHLLLEGMSIRACERITGMNRDTICSLILVAGESVERFMLENIKDVEAKEIQLDEIWDFALMKSRTKERLGNDNPDAGDVWTWLAIDAKSKMVSCPCCRHARLRHFRAVSVAVKTKRPLAPAKSRPMGCGSTPTASRFTWAAGPRSPNSLKPMQPANQKRDTAQRR